jgi:hypothetical protein
MTKPMHTIRQLSMITNKSSPMCSSTNRSFEPAGRTSVAVTHSGCGGARCRPEPCTFAAIS